MGCQVLSKLRHSLKGQRSAGYSALWLWFIISLGMSGFVLGETGAQGPETRVSLEKLLKEPQQYLGRLLVVEGVLEAQGKGARPPYLLRAESGAAVEVSAWAPVEIYRPREGAAKVKSMAYYVGRRLRLTGRLVQEGARLILRVTSAEELSGPPA